ncbi:hypothetical protein LPJ53_000314 [Coemansia erecta]|uniref:TOG domain-containing protein n=1 Tax=Coemansia erecta TaxID=147472 RepID=A0A9W8CTY5_9FUNG|nr:hypothetical protein LPJ53_000314 [Coemansia erecta]
MADEEDYSALPLEQRLAHKVWKVRVGAYGDLTKILKQLDPDRDAGQFSQYESYLPKMVLDTNMAAQEAGIATVIAFVENAPNPVRRREEIVSGVVSKCLAATKAGTRTQSVELLLVLCEVDTPGPVVTGVIEGFDAKQPKAVAAAVTAIKDIVHAFGVKFLTLKPLLKALAKPFSHKDNSVRTEAQHLAVELYRWMGQAIMPSLQDLPPVLLKDLESQFSTVASGSAPKQQRLLRSQQEAEMPAETTGGGDRPASHGSDNAAEDEADAPAGMDPWELADPVDITKKLPDDYHTFVVSSKWKERKEVIEHLHGALKKSIRLQMSPGTGDIIQEMGKKIGDINIIVATLAIQCLGLLASGLRQSFSPYIQSTLPALIERSKERKQTVTDAIRETEDAYFLAAGCDLAAFSDHYFTGAGHKNPQTRAESNHMLRRCLAVTPTRPGKTDVKRYADQLKTGLDDGDSGVRESAAECLGTLSKLVTAKVLDPFIESVDKIKLEKVNEYASKATIKAKAQVAARPKPAAAATAAGAGGKPRPRPRPAGAAAPASKPAPPSRSSAVASSGDGDDDDGESNGLSANLPPHIRKKLEASARAAAIKKAQREGRPIDDLLPPPSPAAKPAPPRPAAAAAPKRPAGAPPASVARKPAASSGAPSAAKPGAKGKPAAASKEAGEAIKMRFANDESLDDKIAGAIPENILTAFDSAKWKDRMEAMDQLKDYLGDQAASGSGVHPELVVRQLARKPGWKESNFQVNQRAFQIIEWMATEESLDFNTGAAALCAQTLVDKLGDIKLKGPASAALVAIAQRYTLRFVVGLVIEPIRSQKSPKVLADCLAWLDTQMLEFGTKSLALRPVVEMVKEVGLQSSNAQTRTKAVSFMGTLRRAVGAVVMDLMGDLNPQLLQLIEAEFERVASQPMPDPIHTQRGLAGDGSGAGGSGAGKAGGGQATDDAGEDPMDELFPRQDLNTLVDQGVYKKLNDNNWKERKAGLDTIQAALDGANHRILPNISADLYTALKHRLQDPNKNLITVALGLLGALSSDSGGAQVPNIRIVALATMHCLADKKPQLRNAALAAMVAWSQASSACVDQAILPAIPNALSDTSPELRSSLLQWTADTLGPRDSSGARLPDLSLLISPLFTCLQDRNSEVRKQANRVLKLTVVSCGFETVHDACSMQLQGAAKAAVAPMIEEFRHAVGGDSSSASRRPGGGTPSSKARPGGPAHAMERVASPSVEPVMTASELLGRAPSVNHGRPGPGPAMAGAGASPPGVAAATAASGGPGMLRRPMAVRRPAGSAGASAPGIRPGRPAMRGPGGGAVSSEHSRPGSSMRMGTPTPQSLASQMARMSNEELEAIPPILDCDIRAKEQRARRDMATTSHGVPRWAQLGDARVRADLESQLSEQASQHFNPMMHRLLFSTSHYKDRDNLNGLTTIEEVISIPELSKQRFNLPLFDPSPDADSLAMRYIANIDILLKYISIRMYDGSTHTLVKSFDLVERLIHLTNENRQKQQEAQASWSDYEVQAVLPALISRLGDAKEIVRARARRILTHMVTHLYPTTKLFTVFLEHGVTNRSNARVRQESLDSICFLIRERTAGCGLGAVCAQPSRAVPIIAQGIADRDSNVRTATLNVLVAVGEQLPGGADELWRLCGRMAEKERTMLEEKIKRSSIATESAAPAVVGGPRPGSRIGMMGSTASAAAAGRSRIASSIARPNSQASGAVGGVGRNGGGMMGASRLARPAGPPAPPVSSYASEGAGSMAYSGGHTSYTSTARPMFTLDFDKLNLPTYSSATADHLNNPASGRGIGLRPPVSAPPMSQMADVANTAIGYGAGRRENLQGSLNGLHIGMPGGSPGSASTGGARGAEHSSAMYQMAGSPDMRGASRPMSMAAYSSPLTAADFPTMSEPERDEFMQSIVADLSGDDSKASERAIDRLGELFKGISRPTEEEKRNPQLYLDNIGPAHVYIRSSLKDLVTAIAVQIRWAYTTTSTDPSLQSPLQATVGRIRENTLGILIEIFTNFYFAMHVPVDAIQTVIDELIHRSVDPMLKLAGASPAADGDHQAGGRIPNGQDLLKVINTILVKIIDNADRTNIYVALIQLLDITMAEPAPNPPQTDFDIVRMNCGDMVQKCLWRLTKTLPNELKRQFGRHVYPGAPPIIPRSAACPEIGDVLQHPAVRVDPILRMAHRFFDHTPEREWRKREDSRVYMFGDLPRRTVKTILHGLIVCLRTFTWQFGGLIIRDVMAGNPGYIKAPPPSNGSSRDPVVVAWVEDTNRKLVGGWDVWRYISTTNVDAKNDECPSVEQMMAAMQVAQSVVPCEGDDFSDNDSDVDMAPAPTHSMYHHQQQQQQQQQHYQAGSRGSYAGSAASMSPYQQPRQMAGYMSQGTGNIERAQSPAGQSYAPPMRTVSHMRVGSPQPAYPPRPAGEPGSNQDRLSQLRARILKNTPPVSQQQLQQGSSGLHAPSSPGSMAASTIPQRRPIGGGGGGVGGGSQMQTENSMDNISARLDNLRKSLRSSNNNGR